MKKCNFRSEPNIEGGNILTCMECGRVVLTPYETVRAKCPKAKIGDIYTPPTIDNRNFLHVGNIVSSALSLIGITKELVTKITGTQNKPGGCGCEKRQDYLNEIGYSIQKKIYYSIEKLKVFIGFGE